MKEDLTEKQLKMLELYRKASDEIQQDVMAILELPEEETKRIRIVAIERPR